MHPVRLGDPCPGVCMPWTGESMLWDWGCISWGYEGSMLWDWGVGDVHHRIGVGSAGCTSWGHEESMLWVRVCVGGMYVMGGVYVMG